MALTMMQAITLRDYTDTDQKAVMRVHDLARPVELVGSCHAAAFVPLADDADDLAEFLSVHKTVACINDNIVGFVGVEGDQLGWLYVDPQFARRGIGRRLLRHALEWIVGAARVHVLAGNAPALRLYHEEGFTLADTFDTTNHGYPCRVQALVRPA
ncbi:MAG: GNAT superfamily N-acetyltransferase [Candidatus Azotimanducaceae bacterium]|jgi:GNAT superfamily N-acetyltransferase